MNELEFLEKYDKIKAAELVKEEIEGFSQNELKDIISKYQISFEICFDTPQGFDKPDMKAICKIGERVFSLVYIEWVTGKDFDLYEYEQPIEVEKEKQSKYFETVKKENE